MNENIVIKTSIWKSFVLIAGCWIFVLIALLMWDQDSKIIGTFTILLFGGGSLAIVYRVLDRRPRLIIGTEGMTDRLLGVRRIDWVDILTAKLISVYGTKFVALKLNNTQKYLNRLLASSRKLTKVNRMLGFGELNLYLSLLDTSADQVLQTVKQNIRKHHENEH
jgi:hypothetical protein